MRAARLALIAAGAASSLLVASPAQARHVCGLDDPTLNEACESHPENLLRELFCLVSPTC